MGADQPLTLGVTAVEMFMGAVARPAPAGDPCAVRFFVFADGVVDDGVEMLGVDGDALQRFRRRPAADFLCGQGAVDRGGIVSNRSAGQASGDQKDKVFYAHMIDVLY